MPFKNPHPLYSIWQGMLRRCDNKNHRAYSDYGGRGIAVCDRWKTFANFASDMGERPMRHSLEREDNDGNYEPDNCIWATKKQQQRNQRVTRKITVSGNEYIAVELAEIAEVKTDTILRRFKNGLPLNKIISKEKNHDFSGLSLGGIANGKRKKALTHCSHGHEFSEKNTRLTKQGWRTCRECKKIAARERREKIRNVISTCQ